MRLAAKGIVAGLACGLALAPSAWAVAPAEPDLVLRHRPAAKGTILMAHAGAFLFGSPRVPSEAALGRRFRDAGFDVRGLAYPLGSYPSAVAYAERAARRARRRGPVFAVGQSSGGALAAKLAVDRLVDGAVLVAAITDFHAFPLDPALARSYYRLIQVNERLGSPIRGFARNRRSPVYAFHSPGDRTVPVSQSRALAHFARVRLGRLSGDHLEDRSWVSPAGRWMTRLAAGKRR